MLWSLGGGDASVAPSTARRYRQQQQELRFYTPTASGVHSATATVKGRRRGDEAEAAGGPAGWSDPIPWTQGNPPMLRLAFLPFPSPSRLASPKAWGEIMWWFLPAVQVELEQYPTGPHIASRMLYTVKFCAPILMLFWAFGCDAVLYFAMWVELGATKVQLWFWIGWARLFS
jgi:hypothetical protein